VKPVNRGRKSRMGGEGQERAFGSKPVVWYLKEIEKWNGRLKKKDPHQLA